MFKFEHLILVKGKVRRSLLALGYTVASAFAYAGEVNSDLMSTAKASLHEEHSAMLEEHLIAAASLNGGSLIDAIIAFLSSPAGQALIAMLIKLLLGGM